jgi:hypothetical protein
MVFVMLTHYPQKTDKETAARQLGTGPVDNHYVRHTVFHCRAQMAHIRKPLAACQRRCFDAVVAGIGVSLHTEQKKKEHNTCS